MVGLFFLIISMYRLPGCVLAGEMQRTPKYNSARRQAQARETRRQIIEAAHQLFTENGYAGATIEAIAQEGGVAPETVYATFGNKRSILVALVNNLVGGDDQPIPLLQRPGPQNVLQERDASRQIHLFAQDISNILERVAPLFEVVRAAAKTEPDIDVLLQSLLNERLRNLTTFVQHLAANKSLRAGLDEVQAGETVWTLSSPEVFSLLIRDRGWTKERYAQWLGDSLSRLLLP